MPEGFKVDKAKRRRSEHNGPQRPQTVVKVYIMKLLVVYELPLVALDPLSAASAWQCYQ